MFNIRQPRNAASPSILQPPDNQLSSPTAVGVGKAMARRWEGDGRLQSTNTNGTFRLQIQVVTKSISQKARLNLFIKKICVEKKI